MSDSIKISTEHGLEGNKNSPPERGGKITSEKTVYNINSLRWHYPYQVKGTADISDISAFRRPCHVLLRIQYSIYTPACQQKK